MFFVSFVVFSIYYVLNGKSRKTLLLLCEKMKRSDVFCFLDKDVYVFLHYLLSFVLVSVTEETEQVEEKVDEV